MPDHIAEDPTAMQMGYGLVAATQDLTDEELDWLYTATTGTSGMFTKEGHPAMATVQDFVCSVLASEGLRRREIYADAFSAAEDDPK